MAHYAKVINGIVDQVIVAEPEFFDTFVDSSPGEWVKTSYNMSGGVYHVNNTPDEDQSIISGDEARQRKNYASVGYNYDGVGFYSPPPHASWNLNKTTYLWEPPITYPSDGKSYVWDDSAYQADNTKGWIEDK